MPLSRRKILTLAGSLALGHRALVGAARASTLSDLYRARTIVTGRRPETRIPGMVRCLAQVLVRVSGDPRLARHPQLADLSASPEAAVTNYSYRDLYAFRPIKDEQGTRDRPYEMTVEYDPAKVDAMLAQLGSKPWLGERPQLFVFLAVHHIGSAFMLTTMGEAGELMRQSFQDAAWSAAMRVAIPSPETVARAGLTVDTAQDVDPAALLAVIDRKAGWVPLVGLLDWSRPLLAWKVQWRLAADGGLQRWGTEGVNFDAAFRNGVGGAAQVFSGNGTPG